MGERPERRSKRTGWALVLTLIMVGTVGATGRFLLQSGPPPLRFASAETGKKAVLPPLFPETANTNSINDLAASTNALEETNFSGLEWESDLLGYTNSLAGPAPWEQSSNSSIETPPISDSQGLPAGELLIVTPQMLAEYLKPIPGVVAQPGTNGPQGANLLFSPPAPRANPGSSATYQSP